ncbi:MAG: hypothetical protein ACK5PQ_00435 [Alphaproteobacteria bacterium]
MIFSLFSLSSNAQLGESEENQKAIVKLTREELKEELTLRDTITEGLSEKDRSRFWHGLKFKPTDENILFRLKIFRDMMPFMGPRMDLQTRGDLFVFLSELREEERQALIRHAKAVVEKMPNRIGLVQLLHSIYHMPEPKDKALSYVHDLVPRNIHGEDIQFLIDVFYELEEEEAEQFYAFLKAQGGDSRQPQSSSYIEEKLTEFFENDGHLSWKDEDEEEGCLLSPKWLADVYSCFMGETEKNP